MERRVGMMALAPVLVTACQPIDGEVFTMMTEGIASGDAGSFECIEDEIAVVDGNAPWLSHECGEECDSDWCGCDPCRAVVGPIGRLAQGAHELRIAGGVSGVGDYQLTVRLESGEVLADRSLTHEGLFDEYVQIDVPSDCPIVEIEWVQLNSVCSRFYEVYIEPQ